MAQCARHECQTTAGCAHRGPRGEMCWFESQYEADSKEISRLRARVERLEGALRHCVDRLAQANDEIKWLRGQHGHEITDQDEAADDADNECLSRARTALQEGE